MPDILTIIIALTGLISTLCGIVLSVRNIKRTSPVSEIKKEFAEFKKCTDDKLANDFKHIKKLNEIVDESIKLNKILLRSVKSMLTHLADGNHTNEMTKCIKQIDEFLIER